YSVMVVFSGPFLCGTGRQPSRLGRFFVLRLELLAQAHILPVQAIKDLIFSRITLLSLLRAHSGFPVVPETPFRGLLVEPLPQSLSQDLGATVIRLRLVAGWFFRLEGGRTWRCILLVSLEHPQRLDERLRIRDLELRGEALLKCG